MASAKQILDSVKTQLAGQNVIDECSYFSGQLGDGTIYGIDLGSKDGECCVTCRLHEDGTIEVLEEYHGNRS